MEVVYFQLLPLILVLWITVILYGIIKEKNKTYKNVLKHSKRLLIPFVLIILSVVFMPIKLTENNMSVHETKTFEVPVKVVVQETSFLDFQKDNLDTLKQESKIEEPK